VRGGSSPGQSGRNGDADFVACSGAAILRFAPVSNCDVGGGGGLETKRQENSERSVSGCPSSSVARSSEARFQPALPGGPNPRILVAGNAARCGFFETCLRPGRPSGRQPRVTGATR